MNGPAAVSLQGHEETSAVVISLNKFMIRLGLVSLQRQDGCTPHMHATFVHSTLLSVALGRCNIRSQNTQSLQT